MRAVLAVMAAVALLAARVHAEPGPMFRVDFSNPGLTPSNWTLTIYPDGSGHFHSQHGSASSRCIVSSQASWRGCGPMPWRSRTFSIR